MVREAAAGFGSGPRGGFDGSIVDGTGALGALSRFEQKEALRVRNADLARELVRFTGMTHAQVNGQLNRTVGLKRIDEATAETLRRRATEAERWLARL